MPHTITITLSENIAEQQAAELAAGIDALEAELRAAQLDAPSGGLLAVLQKAVEEGPRLGRDLEERLKAQADLRRYLEYYARGAANTYRAELLAPLLTRLDALLKEATQTQAQMAADNTSTATITSARAKLEKAGYGADFLDRVQADISAAIEAEAPAFVG